MCAANVSTTMSNWSSTAGSNQPDSTDLASTLREDLQAIQAAVATVFPGMAGRAWRRQLKSASYALLASDNMTSINFTAGTALTGSAATLGNGFVCLVYNNTGASLTLPDSQILLHLGAAFLFSNGTTIEAFHVGIGTSTGGTMYLEDISVVGTGRFGNVPPSSTGASLEVGSDGASNVLGAFVATNAAYATSAVLSGINRAGTNACNLYIGLSNLGGTSDTEFYVRGDGVVAGDQAYVTGADYAEMFEWNDGGGADRVGRSVCLDNGKIRIANNGDEPIGVISANPTVVGDAADLRWNGRYLHDDFGAYIMELDPATGAPCRKQNPAWDSNAKYVPRMQRPEWAAVGLVGKLRIRKGEVTGARWIKLRDISAQVEEWLVR